MYTLVQYFCIRIKSQSFKLFNSITQPTTCYASLSLWINPSKHGQRVIGLFHTHEIPSFRKAREQKRSEKRGTLVTKEPIFARITWSLLLMGRTTKFRIDKERNCLSKKHWNSVSSISIFSLQNLHFYKIYRPFINFYYMRYVYNFTWNFFAVDFEINFRRWIALFPLRIILHVIWKSPTLTCFCQLAIPWL